MSETKAASKGERTRRALLDVAIERYGRDGFKSSSISAIARDAGVSRSLAYAYFDDGDDLFRCALDEDAAGLMTKGFQPLADAEDGDMSWRDEVLPRLLGALAEHPLAHRVLAGLEPTAAKHMSDLPAADDLRASVAQRLKDGQERGMVRRDIDPDEVGRGAVNLWIGILMWAVQFGTDVLAQEMTSLHALIDAAIFDPAPAPASVS